MQVMESNNVNMKEEKDIQNLHTVKEADGEPTAPHYADMACKVGKDWDFSWNYLYQFFAHEYYSKLSLE
jgi:hypothetical protein